MSRKKSLLRYKSWRNKSQRPSRRVWSDWLRRGWVDGLDCFRLSFYGDR